MRLANESSAGRFLFHRSPPLPSLSIVARPRGAARRPTKLENLVMTKKEEYVDFVARDGVTIYPGRSVSGHKAGSVVRLPKSHAEALAHVSAASAQAEPEPAFDQEPEQQA
jgi:hypothetical protein